MPIPFFSSVNSYCIDGLVFSVMLGVKRSDLKTSFWALENCGKQYFNILWIKQFID